MTYDEFIKSPIFSMRRNIYGRQSRTIVISPLNALIAEMIRGECVEIWCRRNSNLPNNGSLFTNSTPKLRKMMRSKEAR